MKQAMRKDRQHFDGHQPSTIEDKAVPLRFGMRKKRRSVDQVKLVARFDNCGEKGHWHRECRKLKREKPDAGSPGPALAAYMYSPPTDSGLSSFVGISAVMGRSWLA